MSPEEIMDAYNVVIEDLQTNTANKAAAIGNSQRSLGTLAERVASPSGQTSGLANYAYDRTLRPTIDSLSASLTTSGKAQALENLLAAKLRDAKNNYENSRNNYTVASTSPTTSSKDKVIDNEIVSGGSVATQNAVPAKGTIIGTATGSFKDTFEFIVADGNGGFTRHESYGPTREEALAKYYRDYGYGDAEARKSQGSSSSTSGGGGKGTSGGGGGGGGGGNYGAGGR